MSRAEITRINVPSDRSVKVMCSLLPSSVFPSAWKRGSSELCLVSGTTLRGALKKTCSASAWLTSCLSLLLRALPASQSNPITRVQSTIDVYYHHIRPWGQWLNEPSVTAATIRKHWLQEPGSQSRWAEIWRSAFLRPAGLTPRASSCRATCCRARALSIGTSG